MLDKNPNMDINSYKEYLVNLIRTKKPLAKLFRTESNGYIYDTGTSKVLQCDNVEYLILESLLDNENKDFIDGLTKTYGELRILQALKGIKYAVENEHILKSIRPKQFFSPAHFGNLEPKVNTELEQIILEVTERCNLRCGYCIYGTQFEQRRNHSNVDMSEEIARAAIQYLKDHSSSGQIALTFYGGEPLLRFDLIKYCIDYAIKTISNPELYFSLTTNLTLVNKEIAEYLASIENLSLVCSIDGPKDIHDSYRKDIKGNGSFNRAIQGLKYLIEAFGNSASGRLSISMVFAPPYSNEKLERINGFFNQLDWLPVSIGKIVTYPETNSVLEATVDARKTPFDDNLEIEHTMSVWSKQQFSSHLENKQVNFFTKKNVDDSLVWLHQREIFSKPIEEYRFNGCCIPAKRKIYVTAKGDFQLCERIDGAPSFGNVFTGIDLQRLKSAFVDDYSAASIKYCSDCWAIRICTMCYSNCFSNGEWDMNNKNLHCILARDSLENGLISYHEYMEKNPDGLRYLNDIEIS